MMNTEFKFLIEEGMNRIPSERPSTSAEISQTQESQQRRLKPYTSKRSRNSIAKAYTNSPSTSLSSPSFETPLLSNETKDDMQEKKESNSLHFVDSSLRSVTEQESNRNAFPSANQGPSRTITPSIKCFISISPLRLIFFFLL
jgi:hypothetical protein